MLHVLKGNPECGQKSCQAKSSQRQAEEGTRCTDVCRPTLSSTKEHSPTTLDSCTCSWLPTGWPVALPCPGCSQLGNRPFALYPSTLTLDHSLFSTNRLFKLCSESYPQLTSMHSAVPWGKTELYPDQDSTKQCLDTSALLRKSNGNSVLRVPRTLSTPGT